MGWEDTPGCAGVSVVHALAGAPFGRASHSLTRSTSTRQSQATATNDAIVPIPDFAQHYDMDYIIATMLLYNVGCSHQFAFIARPSGRNKKRHAMNIYINNDCIA